MQWNNKVKYFMSQLTRGRHPSGRSVTEPREQMYKMEKIKDLEFRVLLR